VTEELAALVRAQGATVASARELTTLPSPVLERPAWRIELADGRVLKGRLFASAEEGERFAALAAHLPRPGFPALLAHAGRAALLEWIAGEPMPALPPEALLRRAGELLGRLHRRPLPADAETRFASHVSALPEPLAPRLDELVAGGLLERAEGEALAKLASRAFPARCERGLVHLDFCADNLVVTTEGAPFAIDNATLCLAPLDYDLARTALRWPLPEALRAAFLDGYRSVRDPSAYEAHADYWRVCAGVHSARLRMQRRAGDASVPVAALRAVLRERG
jgi:aminoglycoside phosphotransferase (APT) family kinase protein